MGFLGRNSYRQIRTAHSRVNSDISWARQNEFDLRGFVQKNTDGLLSGAGVFLSNRTTLHNLDQVMVLASFFPEKYDDLNSFGNGAYRTEEQSFLGLSYDSDASQVFSYGLGLGIEEEAVSYTHLRAHET